MSTANFLDQDFGSESDDDVNFNPAPADESDNEAADAGSDDEAAPRRKDVEGEPRRPIREADHDDEDEKASLNGADSRETEYRKGDERKSSINAEADADAEGEDEDDEGEEGGGGGRDDDEDEGEEDDEEEEEISGHRRKRRKDASRVQGLFDIEAEVEEDEEEGFEDDDDELKEADGFIADTHPDDNDLPAGGDVDDRRHRELDRRREVDEGLEAQKQAEALRKRYAPSRAANADSIVIPKRLLLPSVEDPSIWGVRCKPGKEREVVFGIMKRVEERASTRTPLTITSAFERGGMMSGYVYMEARKQADIMAALDGLSNVFPRTKTVLVPIKEMPDLLRVTKTQDLEPGSYVRVKRGKYQGDLAQVEAVEQNGLEVELRLVPRLDYGLNEDVNAPILAAAANGATVKRKRQGFGLNSAGKRPPQRLFSEVEAKKKHLKYLQSLPGKKHWSYLNETYMNGYLIKDFKIQLLQTEKVDPTLEEVTKFASGADDGTENLDLNALAANLKASTVNASYLPGDMVEVYDGEQQGVCGKTVSVQGDIVTITVTEGDLKGQTIEVPVKGLRKRFREGDHVKIIGGSRFQDEVGMVVKISEDRVTILSDVNMQEITVFSKDLREATDSGTSGGHGKYDLFELVQLDASTVGIVIRVDRESLRVLDQNGSTRTLMPSQISNKLERRRNAVATDRNGSEIRNDDTVREVGGEGKEGAIMHIHRSYVFLHSRERTENSGCFVARTSNIATVAAKGGRVVGNTSSGPDLNKMNPAVQRNGAHGGMEPPSVLKVQGRDRAIGKTVTIRKGPYKGLLGIVKDTTDLEARVELHTKGTTITVSKLSLAFKDPITGQNMDYASMSGGGRGRGRGGYGGSTPSRGPEAWAAGGRTPMASGGMGGRTPVWSGGSSRTPAWAGGAANGGRTPAWKQDSFGGRTPAYGSEGGRTVNPYQDGSRTSYGGGNKTPAWNPGARTPFGGNSGMSSNAWDSGSKTPAYGGSDAWGSGSKTPAYNSGNDAWAGSKTPAWAGNHTNGDASWNDSSSRGYDPPTPGGDLSAPTPGALNAPTPGGYSAPTPAASAPTPRPPPGGGWGGPSHSGVGGGGWSADSAPTPSAIYSAPTPGATPGGKTGGRDYEGAPTPAGYGNPETPAANWGGAADEDGGPRYSTPSP
ncbi:MAG: transcription elongation factor spt5 [Sclerophora amabilis]|nr:MAG: transcription elongation factor spt5 [Sclerophora amabilis]